MKTITIILFVFILLSAGMAYSHSDAKEIINERMDAMTDMSDKSKPVANMLKERVNSTDRPLPMQQTLLIGMEQEGL